MKKRISNLFNFAACLLISSAVFAQAPEKFSYQAIIRNNSGDLIVNTTVSMKISILKLILVIPPTYQTVYSENHTVVTNANGLVSIKVGDGAIITGSFNNIDWGNGEYYIKTEIDPAGGTNYTIQATSQLLSVPYALYAKNVKNFKTYKVGDFAHGGIVFWVDESGQHGLVCAKTDQSAGIRWYAGTYAYALAKSDGPKAGLTNTVLIIAKQGAGDSNPYAARLCNELKITEGGITYGDWYLPSVSELHLMNQNKAAINATAAANGGTSIQDTYWSSNDEDNNHADVYSFSLGVYQAVDKKNSYRVRAVRAF